MVQQKCLNLKHGGDNINNVKNDDGGDKRAKEIFARALKRKSFKETIKVLRQKYWISPNDYLTEQEADNWICTREFAVIRTTLLNDSSEGKLVKEWLELDEDLSLILKEYDLPATMRYILRYYFLTDKLDSRSKLPFFSCALAYPTVVSDHIFSEETYWRQSAEKYIRLLIHSSASKPMVLEYVEKNWGEIESMLRSDKVKKSKQKSKRIRTSPKAERNTIIFRLYETASNEELGMKPEVNKYRDIAIAKRMNKMGYPEVTPEIVRNVASKERRNRDL